MLPPMDFAVIVVVLLLLVGLVYALYRGMQTLDNKHEKKERRRREKEAARHGDYHQTPRH